MAWGDPMNSRGSLRPLSPPVFRRAPCDGPPGGQARPCEQPGAQGGAATAREATFEDRPHAALLAPRRVSASPDALPARPTCFRFL